MSCLADVEIHFTVSGVKISPYDLDVQSNYDKHDYIRATVSQAAADLVSKAYLPHEPVEIYTDGNLLGRALVPKDEPLEYDNDTHDFAYLTLLDQRKVLGQGVIDGMFSDSLGKTIEAIIDAVDDEHGVITGVDYASSIDVDDMPEAYRAVNRDDNRWFFKARKMVRDAIEWESTVTQDLMDWTGRHSFAGFRFDHVPPVEALAEVQDEFGFEVYIDRNGTFWVGPPNLQLETYVVGEEPGMITLNNYAVPTQVSPLKTVVIQGGKVAGQRRNTRRGQTYVTYARATRTDVDADRVDTLVGETEWKRNLNPLDGSITLEKQETDGALLQNIAANELSSVVTGRKQGSITVNGLTSTPEAGLLHELAVGQNVLVTPHWSCKHREIGGGAFTVTGYQHQINPSDGWTVTIEVASNALSAKNVETEFFVIDPYTGDEIDPSEVYLKGISE